MSISKPFGISLLISIIILSNILAISSTSVQSYIANSYLPSSGHIGAISLSSFANALEIQIPSSLSGGPMNLIGTTALISGSGHFAIGIASDGIDTYGTSQNYLTGSNAGEDF